MNGNICHIHFNILKPLVFKYNKVSNFAVYFIEKVIKITQDFTHK